MNVKKKNEAFLNGYIDTPGLFPQLDALKRWPIVFDAEFGLEDLPLEPGLIMIRGPRQLGKSTWLEQQLRATLEEFGKGSAFYLNGEDILDVNLLESAIEEVIGFFNNKVKRLFIDEITAIKNWELAIKRLWDRGVSRDCLIITTGSKSIDLRRGTERLPGRKGRLERTNYIFTPISFRQFLHKTSSHIGEIDPVHLYLLSGGSAVALNEFITTGAIPKYVFDLTRDWIFGELALHKRNRALLKTILDELFLRGGTPISMVKLARETGSANNTVVTGYIELLQDLMCVAPCLQMDVSKKRAIARKPSKIHFTNLLAAWSFYPEAVNDIAGVQSLPRPELGKWYEWAVSTELWRRAVIAEKDTTQYFWGNGQNEIDFIDQDVFIEVKSGAASPLEFGWFRKNFPSKRLLVVTPTPFSGDYVQGVTLADFLRGIH